MEFNGNRVASTVVVCDEYGDLVCCLLDKWKMSGFPTLDDSSID